MQPSTAAPTSARAFRLTTPSCSAGRSGCPRVRAVVGRIHNKGVVRETEVVDELEQLADVHVVLDHAVAVFVLAGDAAMRGFHVRADDDAKREWVYDRKSSIGHLDKALDEAKAKGWTVVDMKKDWKWVFTFEP